MRLATLVAAAGAAACASAGSPPGGPPDSAPPVVLGFTPDSGVVGFAGRSVIVRFDETISDRGTGQNALEALVRISPRDGEPQVSWSRNRIAVRPGDGFRPNTAYSITVAPGIADLRGNRSATSYTTVFSTGPEIPAGAVSGRAFDWAMQQIVRGAWVEAMRMSDSALFVTTADSAGAFTIPALNPGEYLVRAYVDQNNNRVLDRAEVWDSVRVTVEGGPATGIELLTARRDTFPAVITTLTVTDSVTLTVEFDKPLDPRQSFGPGMFRVVRADSAPVTVARVRTRQQVDSVGAAVAAAARADTAAADTARPQERRPPPRDSLIAIPRPSRPAPPTTLVVTLAEPLEPLTTYRVTVSGVRTLLGRESSTTRIIATPRLDPPAAPGDTSRASRAADPAARPPARTPGRR